MKRIFFSLSLLFWFNLINSQILLSISDNISNERSDVTLSEFENLFYKTNDTIITEDYLKEYLNLFINFKLKVQEARSIGLDTQKSFINELDGYKKQLAKPYLKDKDFENSLLKEAYERLNYDVRASHILVNITTDDRDAYDKALKIRNSIINDELTFEEAAKRYSNDLSAKQNSGDLGFFTAFMMVYDFETAAYNLSVGEISMPVKTKYGYHLIKLNAKRKAVGEVKVAHIMFKLSEGSDSSLFLAAKSKAFKTYDLLKKGDDFAETAEKFSEDRSSAVKGGILPSFGVNKMVPSFEKNAFLLSNVGDISEPFLTDYGWHIIKLIEKKNVGQFDDIKDDLKRKVERDSRSKLSEEALFEKLRTKYNITYKSLLSTRNGYHFPTVYSKIASAGFPDEVSEISDSILFYIENFEFFVSDFEQYFSDKKLDFDGIDLPLEFANFVNDCLLSYEESQLHINYPEYNSLTKEYEEGILLFNITNDKVWNKAVIDTASLENFYMNNTDDYVYPESVDAIIFKCIDLKTANKTRRYINKIRDGKLTVEEVLEIVNDSNPLSLQIESNNFVKGQNEFVDTTSWEEGISNDLVSKDGTYKIVLIKSVLPPNLKSLEDIRGRVISDYQKYLDSIWISELRSKYIVNVNYDLLYNLIR